MYDFGHRAVFFPRLEIRKEGGKTVSPPNENPWLLVVIPCPDLSLSLSDCTSSPLRNNKNPNRRQPPEEELTNPTTIQPQNQIPKLFRVEQDSNKECSEEEKEEEEDGVRCAPLPLLSAPLLLLSFFRGQQKANERIPERTGGIYINRYGIGQLTL
jgi:hypothetical protein